MSRKAFLTRKQLHEYAEEPNAFWQAFEDQYLAMFRPLDTLIREEKVEDWFSMCDQTMKRLRQFIEKPLGAVPQLLILRGWTGSGKTTCVRVLFEKMRDTLPPHTVYLYLDASIASITVADLEHDFDSQIATGLDWQFGLSRFEGVAPSDESDMANRKRLEQLAAEGKLIVIVWDNVDQCPRDIQIKCLQLAHHKLKWIPKQKIIVPVRDYTFSRAETELTVAGYEYTSVRHSPPPTCEVLNLRVGLAQSAIDRDLVDQTRVDLGGVAVTLAHGKEFLSKVVGDLSEQRLSQTCEQLSNGSIRFQLELARYALRSAYLTRDLVLEALRRHYVRREPDHFLVPYHRFLEGILTGGSDQCYRIFSFEDSLLINMFDAGEPDAHFNTLNRHHVAKIATHASLGVHVDEVISNLERLGHSRACTEATIREFLATGMLWSEEGAAEDFPARISKVIPTDSTRCYMTEVVHSLVYVQHMGLVTPLEDRYRKHIVAWPMGDEKTTLLQRMQSAAALLRQLSSDEAAEWEIVRGSADAQATHQEFGLGRVSAAIAGSMLNQISAIRRSSASREGGVNLLPDEWRELCRPFVELRGFSIS